jgi:hypothetical protein
MACLYVPDIMLTATLFHDTKALLTHTAHRRYGDSLAAAAAAVPCFFACCCSRGYTDYDNFVGRWTEGQGWYASALQADKIAVVANPSKVLMCLVGGGCPYNGDDEPTGELLLLARTFRLCLTISLAVTDFTNTNVCKWPGQIAQCAST